MPIQKQNMQTECGAAIHHERTSASLTKQMITHRTQPIIKLPSKPRENSLQYKRSPPSISGMQKAGNLVMNSIRDENKKDMQMRCHSLQHLNTLREKNPATINI